MMEEAMTEDEGGRRKLQRYHERAPRMDDIRREIEDVERGERVGG